MPSIYVYTLNAGYQPSALFREKNVTISPAEASIDDRRLFRRCSGLWGTLCTQLVRSLRLVRFGSDIRTFAEKVWS